MMVAKTAVLQRHHIEVSTILLSGLRLCAVLAGSRAAGNLLCLTALAIVHLLALLLECGPFQLGSPYRLRRSASHGIAQGVLAVPSVLSALVAAAPSDGWQPWLLGSCSAAVAILCVICLQSATAAAAASSDASQVASHNSNCSISAGKAVHNGRSDSHQQQRQPAAFSSIPEATKCSGWLLGRSAALPTSLAAAAGVCVLAIASKQQYPEYVQDLLRQVLGVSQQVVVSGAPAQLHTTVLQLAGWACVAAAGFCLSLQLLPGCFSLGEAALMAQGAACLAVTAAGAWQYAWVFVPAAVCSQLPQPLLQPLQQLGGCTAAAHREALSLKGLSAAITLVLAAAVGACLLLRVLHTALQPLRQTFPSSSGSNGAAKHNTMQLRSSNGSTTPTNGHQKAQHCDASSSSSSGVPLLTRTVIGASSAVVAAAAAGGICVLLVWLCCAAAWTLLEFLPAEAGRLGVLVYWLGVLAATLPALKWLARVGSMPQIIVRKVYHLLAMGLFVPVFFWDLQLLALSLAIAFAALVLLEVLRCMRLPLLGQAVQDFMQEFVDERDAGVIYITHFTLLLGLAVPMWLCLVMPGAHTLLATNPLAHQHFLTVDHHSISSCPSSSSSGCGSAFDGSSSSVARGSAADVMSSWGLAGAAAVTALLGRTSSTRDPSAGGSDASAALLQVTAGLSGLIIIGVGDTAASFVGKLFGRMPVHAGSSKTVEGTVAGISASLGAWVLLLWAVQLLPVGGGLSVLAWWVQLVAATAGAGLMEAATSQLDNILLPLWYLPHLMPCRAAV